MKRTITMLLMGLLAMLITSCGGGSGGSSEATTPTPADSAPVADIGVSPTTSVETGAVVSLDGSGSSDPDGDSLTYAWILTSPAGSSAALISPSAPYSSFTPDLVGTYTVQLVVNDGADNSPAATVVVTAATNPNDADNDGDGVTENQGDCDDANVAIHPGATEICGDGIDQDCSGADLVCPVDPNDVDDDSDGYTENAGDCNDANTAIHPGATENCGDGIDQDCSGADLICPVDPNDVDNDSDGYTENAGDCDDTNANISPNTTWYKDADGDGYSDGTTQGPICSRPAGYSYQVELTATAGDCNDANAAINPGATDIPNDGIDQDCSGADLLWFPAASSLPDTGQTGDYTATFGEDSDYTINPPSYTDHGNGTVTDNVTGLMWQQGNDAVAHNWYQANGVAEATSNPGGATDVCGNLTLAGYTNWRLPSKKELVSILDLDVYNPAINAVVFPGTELSSYWSSTSPTRATPPTPGTCTSTVASSATAIRRSTTMSVVCAEDSGSMIWLFGPLVILIRVQPGRVRPTHHLLVIAPFP
ncbi:MAG: DUF1566 domain-containing protein [Proteobacteria bacterium]|nr:DUF1566 domain-containing protein [Pseudomonadota bacterium]